MSVDTGVEAVIHIYDWMSNSNRGNCCPVVASIVHNLNKFTWPNIVGHGQAT